MVRRAVRAQEMDKSICMAAIVVQLLIAVPALGVIGLHFIDTMVDYIAGRPGYLSGAVAALFLPAFVSATVVVYISIMMMCIIMQKSGKRPCRNWFLVFTAPWLLGIIILTSLASPVPQGLLLLVGASVIVTSYCGARACRRICRSS